MPYSIKPKVATNIHTNPTLKSDIYSELIEYMVKPQKSVEKDLDVLICGSFMKDEYHILEKIQQEISCTILGDNPGLSKPVYDEEYINYFNRAKIYINLSTYWGVSPYLLQAMASGCAIISSVIPATQNLLKDNALYIKNVEDVSQLVKELLNDEEKIKEMGDKVRETSKRFSPDKFIDKWSKLFYRYKDEIYTR